MCLWEPVTSFILSFLICKWQQWCYPPPGAVREVRWVNTGKEELCLPHSQHCGSVSCYCSIITAQAATIRDTEEAVQTCTGEIQKSFLFNVTPYPPPQNWKPVPRGSWAVRTQACLRQGRCSKAQAAGRRNWVDEGYQLVQVLALKKSPVPGTSSGLGRLGWVVGPRL